jgi:hypothetical protein
MTTLYNQFTVWNLTCQAIFYGFPRIKIQYGVKTICLFRYFFIELFFCIKIIVTSQKVRKDIGAMRVSQDMRLYPDFLRTYKLSGYFPECV